MATVNPLFNNEYIMYIELFVKKIELTVGIFDSSTFSMVLCFFWFHLMEIFPMTQIFGEKNIVKHWLTVVKLLKIIKIHT